MLKKTYWAQLFETYENFSNLLIISILQINLPLLLSNTTQNPPTFKFLFRHTSKTAIYTFLNISTELHCLFPHFLMLFQKIYAENFSNLLSA